jgi:hypothetical protein
MSHELRTPLHAIMGMTAMARRRMTDEKGVAHLDKAKVAADHLLAVINDVLDISKIEAGRLQLENVDFSLTEVLGNVVNLVGHKATEKGLQLTIDCGSGIPDLRLRGDPLRLGQILLNLAGNAVKFTERGTVTIRIRHAEAMADRITLRFEVEDTGIGVSTEDSKRLFIAFEQIDGSMTRKYGGTGLGLGISRKLAELMGGEIGFESLATGGQPLLVQRVFRPCPRRGAGPVSPAGRRAGRSLLAPPASGRAPTARRGRTRRPRNRTRPAALGRPAGSRRRRWRSCAEPGTKPAFRPDPDGHADAETQRCRCDAGDPCRLAQYGHPHRGNDCQRLRFRPAPLPGRRNERPHRQARGPGAALPDRPEMAGRQEPSWFMTGLQARQTP